jgi:predicted regulator of Ras-like GTPase activity (Roadblock/LC7/MglB family)
MGLSAPVAPVDPVDPVDPHDPLGLFSDLTAEGEQTALLLDATGLVMAGTYLTQDGRDVAQEVGAELSGVSDEARRAMRHLALGDWSSLTVETDAAVVAMAPMRDDALLLVAASKAMPLGLVHRVLDRCVARATSWLAKGGA